MQKLQFHCIARVDWVLGEDQGPRDMGLVRFSCQVSYVVKRLEKECHKIESPFLDLGNEMTLYFKHLFHMTHWVISSGTHVDIFKKKFLKIITWIYMDLHGFKWWINVNHLYQHNFTWLKWIYMKNISKIMSTHSSLIYILVLCVYMV